MGEGGFCAVGNRHWRGMIAGSLLCAIRILCVGGTRESGLGFCVDVSLRRAGALSFMLIAFVLGIMS